MTIDILEVFSPATQPEWLAHVIAQAQLLGFPGTTWRSGDIGRSIITIMSYAFQRTDATVSLISQGGFLDFAATGTVTYDNADGTTTVVPVSPDPSVPDENPLGRPTWLDVLCESNYNVTRIQATKAGGTQVVLNLSADTYGPFDAGGYHVSDDNNQATYSTTVTLTIPPSSTAGGSITAVANNGGVIRVTTSLGHGLATDDVVWIKNVLGTTEANNAWYVTVLTSTTFNLQGSTFTNAYISGGTVYLPEVTTVTADESGSAFNSVDASGTLDIHTVTTAVTSLVGVETTNVDIFQGSDIESNTELRDRAKLKLQSITTNGARGAYEFYALSSITYAPLLTPAQEVSTKITRVVVTEDQGNGEVYAFLANREGAPSGPDVAATDAVLQVYARPLGITLHTDAATAQLVTVVAVLYVPAAFNTAANLALFVTAMQDYFQELPIGGLSDPGGDYTNILPYNDVLGVLYETARNAGITIDNVSLTLNGATANISLPVSTSLATVAELSPGVPDITFSPT